MSRSFPPKQFRVSSTVNDGLSLRPQLGFSVDSPSLRRFTIADAYHSTPLLLARRTRLGSPVFINSLKRSLKSPIPPTADDRAAVSPPSVAVLLAEHHHWPRLDKAQPPVRSESAAGDMPETPPPADGNSQHVLLTELTQSTVQVNHPLTGQTDGGNWHQKQIHGLGYPMRVFKWTPTFTPSKESSIVPVWVSFPELPAHLFRKEVLFTVASMIGTPLQIDDATLNQSKLSKARACIELDLLKPRLENFQIQICGATIVQRIEYEDIPHYCSVQTCWASRLRLLYGRRRSQAPPRKQRRAAVEVERGKAVV
ncbi:UNVERIFIED_CONTAM: hypothetical protein Sindi_3105000 [Sesamum indicum]